MRFPEGPPTAMCSPTYRRLAQEIIWGVIWPVERTPDPVPVQPTRIRVEQREPHAIGQVVAAPALTRIGAGGCLELSGPAAASACWTVSAGWRAGWR